MNYFRKKVADKMIWKLYKVLELLTDDIEILGAVGSWGDTLSDKECLEAVELWLEKKHKKRLRL